MIAVAGLLSCLPVCLAAEQDSSAPSGGHAAGRVVVQWRFDRKDAWQGWTANGQIAEPAVRDGAMRGKAAGTDPILLGPVFEAPAAPNQIVEIEMRTGTGGQGQLFWTHTLAGKFGGFDGRRCVAFECRGDGRFHVIRLFPFWHPVGKIVRLRLDPPNTGDFAVAAIRIVAMPAPRAAASRDWTFRDGARGWQAWQETTGLTASGGLLRMKSHGAKPILMSPPLSVPAAESGVVSIRMAVDAGTVGHVFCVSRSRFGRSDAQFALHPDGRMHSYHVDVASLTKGDGEIILLGVQPTNVPGAKVEIESIHISDRAQGPPELEVAYFGQASGVNRVGRPAGVVCAVRNVGGEPARNVAARLAVSPGAKLVGPAEQILDRACRELPQTLRWQIQAEEPGEVEASVTLRPAHSKPVEARAKLLFTPVPKVPATGYVPAPRPVKSRLDVGVFYFPGWATMTRWQPILDFPQRRPVLGWYDEGNPEVADWQIKWAAEHGVTFFMVDWYWCKGHRHLEHWLHDAYMKARYRKYLKWAVMWANHNPPHTHSLEDWRNVTRYWIDHYFGMDEYYRIDGKPAVFIWAPRNIRRDLGGSDKAAQLYALSQQMAREAGLPGISFVAMSSHENRAVVRELEREGYRAMTSYHAFQLAKQRAGSRWFSFADVVETSPEVWRAEDARAGKLLSIPLVDTGWASQPWHGRQATVIHGRTPQLFGQLCRKARAYAEQHGKRIIAVGPWNEWGEGSYIEPYAQHGFGDLDQLRAAFCDPRPWPPNVVPADVGLGPYDLPPLEKKTAWDFNTDGNWEGWDPNGHLDARVEGGAVLVTTTGHDPVLQGPGLRVEADRFSTVVIRMKSDKSDHAQLFWGTSLAPLGETTSARFEVVGDGKYHTYRLEVGRERTWRGVITALRFDPAGREGVRLAIDSIRLE